MKFNQSILSKMFLGFVLVTPTLFAQQVSQFSFPLNAGTNLTPSLSAYEVQSNEYWFETSAAALNKGVALKNSVASPLVMVSVTSSAGVSQKLDVQQMNIESEGNVPVSSRKVSAEALQQVGPFGASVALMAKAKTAAPMTLKSTQTFAGDTRLIVTVKEKRSPYKMNLQSASQSLTKGARALTKVTFKAYDNVTMAREQSVTHRFEAELLAPDGQRFALEAEPDGEGMLVMMPKGLQPLPPSQGLYEVIAKSDVSLDGKRVQRNAKLALAISEPTARLSDVQLTLGNAPAANVLLDVSRAGRYEVRVVLSGTDDAGKVSPVMESHAAMDSNAGRLALPVTFPANILKASGLKAPYQISMVKVYDQSQLALLEEHVAPHVDIVSGFSEQPDRGRRH